MFIRKTESIISFLFTQEHIVIRSSINYSEDFDPNEWCLPMLREKYGEGFA